MIRKRHSGIFSVHVILVFICCLLLLNCSTIDLYERVVSIPKHKWQSNFKPSFRFTIKDTTVPYQVFLILRHNEKYNYNNLWVNLYTAVPESKTATKTQYELPLATNEKGWLATAMDDIYEHRIALTPVNQKLYFRKAGEYVFTIEHIMREDPLENVMNVGLRIEKKAE